MLSIAEEAFIQLKKRKRPKISPKKMDQVLDALAKGKTINYIANKVLHIDPSELKDWVYSVRENGIGAWEL